MIGKLSASISHLYQFCKSFVIYRYYSCKLRKIDYFQYGVLVEKIFPAPKSFASVTAYGNYKAVASLKKSSFNFFTEFLEHGISFSTNTDSCEKQGYINRPYIRKVYTFGNERKQIIKKYLKNKGLKREVITVGPYIKGAKFFKSEKEIQKLKEKFGKTLLVFPSHSTHDIDSVYDRNELIEEIKRVSINFNTVLICLYWKDILTGKHTIYESAGLKIVTAGYGNDPAFLSRLKDLIEISSQTMSNNIGTHIGYSVCMDKPHYLYTQKSEHLTANKQEKFEPDHSYHEIKKQFELIFGNYSEVITPEQLELVKKYWGEWGEVKS